MKLLASRLLTLIRSKTEENIEFLDSLPKLIENVEKEKGDEEEKRIGEEREAKHDILSSKTGQITLYMSERFV